jgi:hypothetical protein
MGARRRLECAEEAVGSRDVIGMNPQPRVCCVGHSRRTGEVPPLPIGVHEHRVCIEDADHLRKFLEQRSVQVLALTAAPEFYTAGRKHGRSTRWRGPVTGGKIAANELEGRAQRIHARLGPFKRMV